jgi:hypothetical protein
MHGRAAHPHNVFKFQRPSGVRREKLTDARAQNTVDSEANASPEIDQRRLEDETADAHPRRLDLRGLMRRLKAPRYTGKPKVLGDGARAVHERPEPEVLPVKESTIVSGGARPVEDQKDSRRWRGLQSRSRPRDTPMRGTAGRLDSWKRHPGEA